MPLLIAIGVAALALVIILVLLLSRGGDDNGGGAQGTDSGDGTEETTPSTATISEGYTQARQDEFMTGCEGAGASTGQCQCALDALMEQIPYEQLESQIEDLEGGTLPAEVQEIVGTCLTG